MNLKDLLHRLIGFVKRKLQPTLRHELLLAIEELRPASAYIEELITRQGPVVFDLLLELLREKVSQVLLRYRPGGLAGKAIGWIEDFLLKQALLELELQRVPFQLVAQDSASRAAQWAVNQAETFLRKQVDRFLPI